MNTKKKYTCSNFTRKKIVWAVDIRRVYYWQAGESYVNVRATWKKNLACVILTEDDLTLLFFDTQTISLNPFQIHFWLNWNSAAAHPTIQQVVTDSFLYVHMHIFFAHYKQKWYKKLHCHRWNLDAFKMRSAWKKKNNQSENKLTRAEIL